jgi:hypothetical protein
VHDIADLEGRGVPSMFVASTEFTDAAAAQVRSIGLDVRRVFVPHPIQDRTDDELRALAEAAVDEILATLVEG